LVLLKKKTFLKMVIVLANPETDRSEVLRILLGLIKPKGDFNVVFHTKNGK